MRNLLVIEITRQFMSKKDAKKQQASKDRKHSGDSADDFIEEDPEQDQHKDKNKKLTEYTATFRPVHSIPI